MCFMLLFVFCIAQQKFIHVFCSPVLLFYNCLNPLSTPFIIFLWTPIFRPCSHLSGQHNNFLFLIIGMPFCRLSNHHYILLNPVLHTSSFFPYFLKKVYLLLRPQELFFSSFVHMNTYPKINHGMHYDICCCYLFLFHITSIPGFQIFSPSSETTSSSSCLESHLFADSLYDSLAASIIPETRVLIDIKYVNISNFLILM